MIIVIRHAESQGNADNSLFETMPEHKFVLTELGLKQANDAGDRLMIDFDIETIYSSMYPRTVQTAEIIASRIGYNRKIITDARLRERNMGNMIARQKISETMDERQNFGKFFYTFPFPGGDSGLSVYDRAASFMEHVQQLGFEEDTLIVTHSYTMRAILMYILALPADEFEILNDPGNTDWVAFHPQLHYQARVLYAGESAKSLAAKIHSSYEVFR